VAEATANRVMCCGFFLSFEYNIFYVLNQFVTYLLPLLRMIYMLMLLIKESEVIQLQIKNTGDAYKSRKNTDIFLYF
jgi:hypothetical protein